MISHAKLLSPQPLKHNHSHHHRIWLGTDVEKDICICVSSHSVKTDSNPNNTKYVCIFRLTHQPVVSVLETYWKC